MFLFISNFKKYNHAYRLIILIAAGLLCMMTANVVIYNIRLSSNISISENRLFDDFFGRKCLPDPYPVIIYGDSRTFNGISPDIISKVLQQPSFNLAFSSGGMNESMMRLIDAKLERKNDKKVVILGISPYSLTEKARKNECYNSYYGKLKIKGDSLFISSRGLRLLDIITMPINKIFTIGSPNAKKIHKGKVFSKQYHDNGWCETVVYGDTKKSIEKTLEMYETRDFKNNPISPASISEMLTYIRKWTNEGVQVFAFRPPTCDAMEDIEERKTEFSSFMLEDEIRKHGGTWIEIPRTGWVSYDASHVDAESAKKLSAFIAGIILQRN